MSKRMVRVSEYYSDYCMAGVEAIIIKDERLSNGSVLLGFPLDGELGWYDSCYSTEYRCWWISPDYLEPITTITRSKFK
jgi:hypothetical protein